MIFVVVEIFEKCQIIKNQATTRIHVFLFLTFALKRNFLFSAPGTRIHFFHVCRLRIRFLAIDLGVLLCDSMQETDRPPQLRLNSFRHRPPQLRLNSFAIQLCSQ